MRLDMLTRLAGCTKSPRSGGGVSRTCPNGIDQLSGRSVNVCYAPLLVVRVQQIVVPRLLSFLPVSHTPDPPLSHHPGHAGLPHGRR